MKKIVTIVGYNREALGIYQAQIKNLFSDFIEINLFEVHEITQEHIHTDIILVQSIEIFRNIRSLIEDQVKVVFAGRTILKKGIEKLKEVPSGTCMYLLDETTYLAEKMITVLYQTGFKALDFIPGSFVESRELQDKNIVILRDIEVAEAAEFKAKNIFNIGPSFLDVSTLINIGELLGMDDIICKQNIEKGEDEILASNIGLTEIIKKVNSFESQFEMLLEVTGVGIIALDNTGIIRTFNRYAEKAMGVKSEEAIGNDGITMFQKIPFKSVISNRKAIKDMLIKINNDDFIVSIDPIIHSQKSYGAIATVRKFNDEELKQHKFRAQIIGKGHKAKYSFTDILGESEIITKSIKMAKRMADSNSTVLITGESGTGKELFAQAIHNSSSHRDFQFVAVNCGAIPENLLESELFGYEEGAFTGARKGGKFGLFELAHKGTLFLDEIGEMPLSLQKRLLRVLQEREVMRVGGDRVINIDIRLIAATNKDLKQMVDNGTFREDLYYRLNVLQLKISPLRKRREDIFTLFNAFKKEYNGDFVLTPASEKAIYENEWRGNARELRNCVEFLVNIGTDTIEMEDLPFDVLPSDSIPSDLRLGEQETIKGMPSENKLFQSGNKMRSSKLLFVLRELEKGSDTHKRLGRRTLSEAAERNGIYISEFEVRSILEELEASGFAEIHKGRAGSLITDKGRMALKENI